MTGNASNLPKDQAHLHFEMRDTPNPGKGLGGRLDPNSVLDTKFYSQDPNANQTNTGVVKVDKEGNRTVMNIDGTTSTTPNPVPETIRPSSPTNQWDPFKNSIFKTQ